ncbi:MAG: zinc-ribbon domain-containing protein [Verrucomicrobiae bacterium]|nr:zinc-ribbon domain-containing protein [Verrucomicrobiae bacterium]
MPTHRFCEQCGAALREGVKFCESCGAHLEEGNNQVPEPSPPRVREESSPRSVVSPAEPKSDKQSAQPAWRYLAAKAAIAVGALLVVGIGGWWMGRKDDDVTVIEQGGALPVGSEVTQEVEVAPPTPPVSSAPEEGQASQGAGTSEAPVPAASSQKAETPTATSTPAPETTSVEGGLVESGDFTSSIPAGIEGDGGRWEGPNAGNWSWRFVGPDDMAISIPLKPGAGSGKLTVNLQIAIPEGTLIDPALGGVRVRTRLMDRYESSAVADRLLQPSSEWQSVSQVFEDAGSGPYTLWIEMIGFTGAVYLDQLAVVPGEGTVAASPSGAPGLPGQVGQVPVETWFAKQPWMKELAAGLPPGVTLEVFAAEMLGDAGKYAVELRENHAPESGLDPGEAPRWGIFQVTKDLTEVLYLNPETNRPEPIEVFLNEAKQRLAAFPGGGASATAGAGVGATELERWVFQQDWYRKLAAQMPKGVTLSILQRDDGFEGWTAFEIREHHSPESGFDPNVVPLVGLFEVSPNRDGVGWFDPVSNEWQPIEDFLAYREIDQTKP